MPRGEDGREGGARPAPARAGGLGRWLAARALLAALLATTIGVLPPFLLGAMAFAIRPELGFGHTQLGIAVSGFFAASALASVPGGRLVERVGSRRGMSLAVTGSVVTLVGMALLARTWWHVLALHAVGGSAMALATSASSMSLARAVTPRRQGLAFGLSKGAGPTATMVAGSAIPAIALTVGWRWAYAATVPLAVAFFLLVREDGSGTRHAATAGSGPPPRPQAARALVILSVAVGFGIGASNAMGAFFVESAVGRGFGPGLAGGVLALGSASGIVARGAWGWLSDRRQKGNLSLVAALMATGAVALLALGMVTTPAALVVAAVGAFAAGWGWTGLFVLAVVRISPETPAAAVGITSAGMFGGATVAPLAYGAVADNVSYEAMWALGGGALLVAAALVMIGRREVQRFRRQAGGPLPGGGDVPTPPM